MSGPLIRLRYEGGDADKHAVDMRLLGESLSGLDRIVSDGLIVITSQRVPKRGERAPLLLRAKEPEAGSVDITGYLQEAGQVLALGMPIIQTYGADLIWEWVKGVIHFFSGRKDLSEKCMDAIVDITRDHLSARDRSEERQHEERMKTLDIMRETMGRLGPASADLAAPVGPSVRRLSFTTDHKPLIEVDEEAAEALREHGIIEWGNPQSMMLRTDGFTFHTGKLSVEHPDRAGYLSAEVVDPVFKEESNLYTQAAQQKALIRVLAKPGYRSGRLVALSILHFEGIIDDAA